MLFRVRSEPGGRVGWAIIALCPIGILVSGLAAGVFAMVVEIVRRLILGLATPRDVLAQASVREEFGLVFLIGMFCAAIFVPIAVVIGQLAPKRRRILASGVVGAVGAMGLSLALVLCSGGGWILLPAMATSGFVGAASTAAVGQFFARRV